MVTSLPYSTVSVQMSLGALVMYYAVLVIILSFLQKRQNNQDREKKEMSQKKKIEKITADNDRIIEGVMRF